MPTTPGVVGGLESALVSYGKATPYFPIIELLRRYGHIEDQDDARTIKPK